MHSCAHPQLAYLCTCLHSVSVRMYDMTTAALARAARCPFASAIRAFTPLCLQLPHTQQT